MFVFNNSCAVGSTACLEDCLNTILPVDSMLTKSYEDHHEVCGLDHRRVFYKRVQPYARLALKPLGIGVSYIA